MAQLVDRPRVGLVVLGRKKKPLELGVVESQVGTLVGARAERLLPADFRVGLLLPCSLISRLAFQGWTQLLVPDQWVDCHWSFKRTLAARSR